MALKRNPIPQFIERLFALSKEARGTPADLQALLVICRIADSGPQSAEAFKQAERRIVDDHIDDPNLAKVIYLLSEATNPEAARLLDAIEEKSTLRAARGTACFTRAVVMSNRKHQSAGSSAPSSPACRR